MSISSTTSTNKPAVVNSKEAESKKKDDKNGSTVSSIASQKFTGLADAYAQYDIGNVSEAIRRSSSIADVEERRQFLETIKVGYQGDGVISELAAQYLQALNKPAPAAGKAVIAETSVQRHISKRMDEWNGLYFSVTKRKGSLEAFKEVFALSQDNQASVFFQIFVFLFRCPKKNYKDILPFLSDASHYIALRHSQYIEPNNEGRNKALGQLESKIASIFEYVRDNIHHEVIIQRNSPYQLFTAINKQRVIVEKNFHRVWRNAENLTIETNQQVGTTVSFETRLQSMVNDYLILLKDLPKESQPIFLFTLFRCLLAFEFRTPDPKHIAFDMVEVWSQSSVWKAINFQSPTTCIPVSKPSATHFFEKWHFIQVMQKNEHDNAQYTLDHFEDRKWENEFQKFLENNKKVNPDSDRKHEIVATDAIFGMENLWLKTMLLFGSLKETACAENLSEVNEAVEEVVKSFSSNLELVGLHIEFALKSMNYNPQAHKMTDDEFDKTVSEQIEQISKLKTQEKRDVHMMQVFTCIVSRKMTSYFNIVDAMTNASSKIVFLSLFEKWLMKNLDLIQKK